MFPTLFLSHGSPMMALTDSHARDFLRELGSEIGKPDAILVASAHWETGSPMVNSVERNATIHDFYGFPPELFAMRYEPPGSPALAERTAGLIRATGMEVGIDPERGLDHGAWVPLSLVYPEAEIPVVQISIQPHLGPDHHLRLGQALAPLRQENVLIIGSGSFTHNLSQLKRDMVEAPQHPEVIAFANWFDEALVEHRVDDLLNYRALAPFAEQQHPTEDHLLPIFVAFGAAGDRPPVQLLHSSAMYSALRMDAYAFLDEKEFAKGFS